MVRPPCLRPTDIILMSDDRPVLVLEKTSECPQEQHRAESWEIVRAAELGVPLLRSSLSMQGSWAV